MSASVPTGAPSFSSQILNQGDAFKVTLTTPGAYKYVSSIHPNWMVGSITVVAGS